MSIRDVVITRVARTIAGKTSNILYFKLCGGQTNTGIVVIKVLLSVCRYLWFAEVRCLLRSDPSPIASDYPIRHPSSHWYSSAASVNNIDAMVKVQ